MKRVFNLQKNVNEVTLVINFEDYLDLMGTISSMVEDANLKNYVYTKNLKEVKENIESIEPEYIWDEI